MRQFLVVIGALAVATTALAKDDVKKEKHAETLPQTGTGGTNGMKIGQGPLLVVQADYKPKKGTGTAFLWRSTDQSCPYYGEPAFASLMPGHTWTSSGVIVAPKQFLCAGQTMNESEATLNWWSHTPSEDLLKALSSAGGGGDPKPTPTPSPGPRPSPSPTNSPK